MYGVAGPTVCLALATSEYPRHRAPDGAETRTINETLTYVFRAAEVPCLFSGRPAPIAVVTGNRSCRRLLRPEMT